MDRYKNKKWADDEENERHKFSSNSQRNPVASNHAKERLRRRTNQRSHSESSEGSCDSNCSGCIWKRSIVYVDSSVCNKISSNTDKYFDDARVIADNMLIKNEPRDYAYHYEQRRCFFERKFSVESPDPYTDWTIPVNRYNYYKHKQLLWNSVEFNEYFMWETWWLQYLQWHRAEVKYFGEKIASENSRKHRKRDWDQHKIKFSK